MKSLLRNRGGVTVFAPTLAALGLVVTVLGSVFLVGMRMKLRSVQRVVRSMNKAIWNPKAMHTAGAPGAYASIIHHVGRRSGAFFETPIVAMPFEGGYVIVLPYGTRADWVQNVLEAGRGELTHEGRVLSFEHAEIVPLDDVASCLSRMDRIGQRVLRAEVGLQLYTTEVEATDSPPARAASPRASSGSGG